MGIWCNGNLTRFPAQLESLSGFRRSFGQNLLHLDSLTKHPKTPLTQSSVAHQPGIVVLHGGL